MTDTPKKKRTTKKATPAPVDLGTMEMQQVDVGDEYREVVEFYLLRDTARLPTRGTAHAAMHDIYAAFDRREMRCTAFGGGGAVRLEQDTETAYTVIAPGARMLIPTGLIASFASDHVMKLYSRSGNAIKKGLSLVNGVGVIDSDYTDEIMVPVVNLSRDPVVIKDGDRIAQFEITPVTQLQIEQTHTRPRRQDRQGGFGSTGE